jgi:cytidine deaminase
MAAHDELLIDSGMIQKLLEGARATTAHAYVPYSSFPVGAAILVEDGTIVTGVNIENASYGLTVCGERVAIFNAAAQGYREVRAVAVSAPRSPGATPCGACRQVLNEFKPANGEMTVILDGGADAEPRVTTLAALLPHAFGPRDLDHPDS